MTILLIGSTCNGKSALGNFLLDPSEEHIICKNPTFPVATSAAPKTKEVTVASKDGLTVIDTPGLNQGECEDFVHMIAIVKKLNELQSISACILCVKFDSRIDLQCKATSDYYKQLLPQLFENNVLVVFTNYCTDEKSKFQRKRQNICEERGVENMLREVCKGLLYRPAYFLIDALPFDEEDCSLHEATRSSILEFTRKLKPVCIHKSLKVLKTPAVVAEDRMKIEYVRGEIKGYEEAIQILKGQKKEVIGQMTSDQLLLSDAKHRLEKLDSTDLETTEVWDINEEWKWFKTQSKEFMVKSEWPIADYKWWDNGKIAEKQVKRVGKYSISIAIKGEFMTRLQAKLTVQVKKCDKYEEEIKETKEKILALKRLSTEYEETLKDLETEIFKLDSHISERSARIRKLEEGSMTVEEAEERLKKLYL